MHVLPVIHQIVRFEALRPDSIRIDLSSPLGRDKSKVLSLLDARSLKTPHRGVFSTLPPNPPLFSESEAKNNFLPFR